MIELDKDQERLRKILADSNDPLHSYLVNLVRDRFVYSYRHINGRYEAWRNAEKMHLAYVDPDQVDKAGEKIFTQSKDIVVPYSFAVLQTRLTYFFFAILSKNPLAPITGRGPNDFIAAKLMEVVQDQQMSETKATVILYGLLNDAERYGVGIVKNIWSAIEEEKWSIVRKPITFAGIKLTERLIKERNRTVVYEGNMPFNISPFNFFPDPRCNIADIKRMEFCGHTITRSYNYLKMAEASGEYFNIDKIPLVYKDQQNKAFEIDRINQESELARIAGLDSSLDGMLNNPAANESKDSATIRLKELSIRVVPKEHKLSSRDYPQEWLMTLANDQTIIKCEPSIYPEFNYYVTEVNHDYAAPANLGTADLIGPLSEHLSWLYNSHMANVRKVINDSIIVDPSVIEIKDLFKKSPVKVIRIKEDYWGNPNAMAMAYKQLQISDITRGHIQDSQIVMNLIQRVSAATDNIMGMVEEVKRTATETSSTINLATARLKLTAYIHFILAIKPMYKAQVSNNQGFLTEDRYYKITDDIAKALGYDPEVIKNRILVTPDKLYGNFDFDIPNLDIPIDKANMAKLWKEIITDTVSNPVLMNRFDIVPMYKQMLYNLGITNFNDFEVKTKVMPDEQVQQMAKDGSLAPLNDVAQMNQEQVMQKLLEAQGGGNA